MKRFLFLGLLLLLFTSQAYASLTDNLVSYYNFDETTGNLIDIKDYDNNGTNTSVTQNQTGIINKAYSYNGSSSKTDLTNANTFIASSEISTSQWIKPSITSGIYTIWASNNGNTNTIEYRLFIRKCYWDAQYWFLIHY